MPRRKKKKYKRKVTYDSEEIKVLLALVLLFFGVLVFLSFFLEGPIFRFLRSMTGTGTFLLGLFLLTFSLILFKPDSGIVKKRTVIGLFILTISFAAFVNSVFGGDFTLTGESSISYGGYLGYYVYDFLSERLFLNFTPFFLFTMMVFSIPLVFSLTFKDFFQKLGQFNSWMFKRANSTSEVKDVQDQNSREASTFGDFRRQAQEKEERDRKDGKSDKGIKLEDEIVEDSTVSKLARGKSKETVKIKEKSVEGAYINEELQFPNWKLPKPPLLNTFTKKKISQANINKNADIIEQTLKSFGVKASVVDVLIGPTVTQYALDIALGTKVKKISNLSNDLALALATSANAVRIEAPIAGTSYVGIEIPNEERQTVYAKEVLSDERLIKGKFKLPLGVGRNLKGETVYTDLQKLPHLLIAGATGSGKSVLTNGFITSILMSRSPDEVKFIMIDPKQVELSDYNGIPHLLTPVITEMDKVLNALKWAIAEMERRYTIFKDSKVRNIEAYNDTMGFSALPYIIIVVDEMADMMMSTNKVETETAIVRLAQKARATGIHLILATQRPSVDVITGLIKANIPGRVGMSVTTQIDSRVILDHIGAESLLGMGDLLYKDPSINKAKRIQGFWLSTEEIQRVVKFIKEQVPEVEYTKEVIEKQIDPNASSISEGSEFSEDNNFANAVRIVVNSGKGSASLLQRKLSIGYNRAARLLDELEEYGVVGPPNGSKPRDVLISDAEEFLSKNDEVSE